MGSLLYTPDGRVKVVRPANGKWWTLDEKRELVGGNVEELLTIDGEFMLVNDMGKIQRPPLELNKWATRIYVHGRSDVICGPALVVETRAELEAPEEEAP